MAPSGFGGRGVLPGVATGTDLSQKSSKVYRLSKVISVEFFLSSLHETCIFIFDNYFHCLFKNKNMGNTALLTMGKQYNTQSTQYLTRQYCKDIFSGTHHVFRTMMEQELFSFKARVQFAVFVSLQ